MIRAATLLAEAAVLVEGDRAHQHGPARQSLELIAELWSAYLRVPVQASGVALLMALLKVARVRTGASDADHFINWAGYAAIASELVVDGSAS